jgi:cytochrome c peroxidase
MDERARQRPPASSVVTAALLFVFGIVSNNSPADELSNSMDGALAALPSSVPSPEDNMMTPDKVSLGKQLFFDPRLSGDNTMSCATCHLPEKAFGDGLARSKGAGGKKLTRNTPTLLNVGFHSSFFWDGRAASLEDQALGPIQSPDEMNQDLEQLVKELASVPEYAKQFQGVFGRPVNQHDIAKALAAFQRTLVTRNSPLDRYLAGDKNALSSRAKEGIELFVGAADCIRCHSGPLLSDGKYYRLGIGHGDQGRGAVTGKREELYQFRTPSLRDVARTGPYMHDGSLDTLYDVVQFYFRGVPSRGPDGLNLDVEPLLGQSYSDIDAVVEFLKSLSGEPPEVTVPRLP